MDKYVDSMKSSDHGNQSSQWLSIGGVSERVIK